MEKIIYSNLIDLLLEYGNKTAGEIVDDAIERFGFPRHELEHNVTPLLAFKENAGYIEKYKNDGRFHLLDIDFDSEKMGRRHFASILSAMQLDGKQHLKKLKRAFEERGFI